MDYPENCFLLGKLSRGEKKLDGKTFYFDRVKKRSAALLLEIITLFGGKIESFLHKEVSFVVTGSLEDLVEPDAKAKTAAEEAAPSKQRERNQRQKQGTPWSSVTSCGSRGKALLEKAILNKERLQGTSILTNARSWGVKILYADDVLGYLKQLSRECFEAKSKKSEKGYVKQSANVVKAASLRSPYLKIEDRSRKYRPLHMQSMTFPALYYSGRYSPFECPPVPRFDKWTEPEEKKNKENKAVVSTEGKCQTPLGCGPSPWKPRKKDAYCECCRHTYNNQEEHLQSDQHRAFVLDVFNYNAVDQLVADMSPGFNPDPPQPEPLKQETMTIPDVYELQPLTDMETEDAVKALQSQEAILISDTSSPSNDSPPEIQQPSNNSIVDISALPSSPMMPVLEIMSQEPPLLNQHPHLDPLSPCSVNVCKNPDLLPPVLSPHMLDLYTHSSYSEPPVLSPQQFTSPEAAFQMGSQSCVSQCFPVDPHHSTTIALMAEKTLEETEQEIKVCCSSWRRRSHSLPRQSTTVVNSKKRSRSASAESSLSKRRKTDDTGRHKQKFEMTKDKDVLFVRSVSNESTDSSKPVRTLSHCAIEYQDSARTFSAFDIQQGNNVEQRFPFIKPPFTNASMDASVDKGQNVRSNQQSELSNSHSTSVCIESALIPDVAALHDSDSDWDCELLSHLSARPQTALTRNKQNCELDKELLQQPCTWMHDSSYESRLHSALQPPPQPITVDSATFSRTVVQIVEVQH